jgi:hypothetical protein
METYIVQFLEDETLGVHGISVVDDPANEFEIVTLKKQSVELRAVDREKRLFFSAVLIPNQKIPRVSENGEPFNIMFPEETIRMAQQNYIKRGYATNSTLEHNENDVLNGITFVEHWIKEDAIHDKSVKFSKEDLPLGTWCTIFRVDNEEILNKIESGEINGISIDGEFKFEKVNLKSEINMNVQEIVKEALTQLGLSKTKEIKLGKIPFEADAEMAVYFEGEELVVGTALFLEEEMTTPAPDGEHVLAGGNIVVTVDGLVTEIKEVSEVEAKEEEAKEEEKVEMSDDLKNFIKEEVKTALESMSVQMAKVLASEIDKAKKEVKSIKAETVALGATSPEVVREIKEPKNFKERMFNELQKAK